MKHFAIAIPTKLLLIHAIYRTHELQNANRIKQVICCHMHITHPQRKIITTILYNHDPSTTINPMYNHINSIISKSNKTLNNHLVLFDSVLTLIPLTIDLHLVDHNIHQHRNKMQKIPEYR